MAETKLPEQARPMTYGPRGELVIRKRDYDALRSRAEELQKDNQGLRNMLQAATSNLTANGANILDFMNTWLDQARDENIRLRSELARVREEANLTADSALEFREWHHGCDALCNNITLLVPRCPHCGRVRHRHAFPDTGAPNA